MATERRKGLAICEYPERRKVLPTLHRPGTSPTLGPGLGTAPCYTTKQPRLHSLPPGHSLGSSDFALAPAMCGNHHHKSRGPRVQKKEK